MKALGLTEDRLNLLGWHAVIHDKVETNLGLRKVKVLSCAVDRARGAWQVGAQIDDRNDLCASHPTLLLPAAPYRPESNVVQNCDGRNLPVLGVKNSVWANGRRFSAALSGGRLRPARRVARATGGIRLQ